MFVKVSDKDVKVSITDPAAVSMVLRRILKRECAADRDKEHFWAIGLSTRNNIRYVELVSLGILNASLVHCRELFRTAITKGGISALIVSHNHPQATRTRQTTTWR